MSDGNYNRHLLPYKPYASGLRAGRAQIPETALKALENRTDAAGIEAATRHDCLLGLRKPLLD